MVNVANNPIASCFDILASVDVIEIANHFSARVYLKSSLPIALEEQDE